MINRRVQTLTALVVLLTLSHPLTLQAQGADEVVPRSLRDDIRVEFFMDVAERSIRLVQDPVSGQMYYNTLTGDVYRITGQGQQEKLYRVEDHGSHRLMDMSIDENDVWLSVNLDDVNDGLGTKGVVTRGTRQTGGERVWPVVGKTGGHGGGQTTRDHGFNDIIV